MGSGSHEHYCFAASAAGRKGRGKEKKRKKKKERNQIVFYFVCIVSFVDFKHKRVSNNLLRKIASDLCTFCNLGNYLGKFLLLGIKRYCSRLGSGFATKRETVSERVSEAAGRASITALRPSSRDSQPDEPIRER